MSSLDYMVCHECDLLLDAPKLEGGEKAHCPRCRFHLSTRYRHGLDKVLAFALSAMVFLAVSVLFPFLGLNAQGQERQINLLQSLDILIAADYGSLAVLFLLTVLVIPLLWLAGIAYVFLGLKQQRNWPASEQILRLANYAQPWNMAEIFIIGILVSFIKIAALADISLGLSFWAFILFVLCLNACVLVLDKHQTWRAIQALKPAQPALNMKLSAASVEPVQSSALKQGYHACHICTGVAPLTQSRCSLCNEALHARIPASLQKTWAWLLTSILLFIPANLLPIMQTYVLGKATHKTIFSGVISLWQHGSYPIAAIIFIASILVPVAKMLILIALCLSVQFGRYQSKAEKTTLYRMTELIGRWSMIDIFVVIVLAALIQLGGLMNIYPGFAAITFALMVITTMFAAISFDPKLLWDQAQTAGTKQPNKES